MKVMHLPVDINKDGKSELSMKRYEIKDIGAGWFSLSCDGAFIAKLVSEEECRRVIWVYWTNLGMDLAFLTEDDFEEVEDE